MAIDYIIDYQCYPKQELTTKGILDRLKARERAETIINIYRAEGDERPPSEMGFEFTRSTPDGGTETQTIIVQDLIHHAAPLDAFESYCAGCPANRIGKPFGCIGFIQYPISTAAELWLLKQLPSAEEALPWLLLRQGIQEFGYDGSSAVPLRSVESAYFEQHDQFARDLVEFTVTTNQLFEMIFLTGDIQPNHAGVLLLFVEAIRRDLDAEAIMHLTPASENALAELPFLLEAAADDDQTIAEFKNFFKALYLAWILNVGLLLDV